MAAPNLALGHVIPGPGSHAYLLWPTTLFLFGGLLAALMARRRGYRRLGAASALVGLLGSIAVYATEPSLPTPPGYTIRVAVAPDPQPSPVRVEVCATTGSARVAAVPGPGRLVEIGIDGRIASEGATSSFRLSLGPGPHRMSAEVVRADHVEFVPPVIAAEVAVTVEPQAPPPKSPTC